MRIGEKSKLMNLEVWILLIAGLCLLCFGFVLGFLGIWESGLILLRREDDGLLLSFCWLWLSRIFGLLRILLAFETGIYSFMDYVVDIWENAILLGTVSDAGFSWRWD